MHINTDSNKQIKFGAIISYTAIFFNIIAGLIYTPWMIHKIGQSEYALYTLALSIISFFTMDFGLGEAVSRFMSKYNAENDREKAKNFLGITFKLYIIIDFLIILSLFVLFLFIDNIYKELTSIELNSFKIVFFIASLYSIASFPFIPLNGILISNEKFIFLNFTILIHKTFTIITMIVVLVLGYRLYSLVMVNLVSGIIIILLKLFYLTKNNLLLINIRAKDKFLVKSIFCYSAWSTIIVISQRFIISITPTVLAAFSGSIQISLFAIAMSIEGYIWTFASALNGLFLPKVTRMTVECNNSLGIENLMIKVGRFQLIITGLVIIGFITMGKEFMTLWIGEGFVGSYYIAIFLICNGLITLTQQIGNTALIAINEIKYRAMCVSIHAVISFTLSLVFSQKYGALGSALAIFIGGLVGSVIGMNIVYYKILKINIVRFFKECHIKMAMPLLLAAIAGVAIQNYWPVQNLYLFLIKAFLMASLYLVFMWFFALNKFEKGLFIEFFKFLK